MLLNKYIYLYIFILFLASCSVDSSQFDIISPPTNQDPLGEEDQLVDSLNVQFFNEVLVDDNLILINDTGNDRVFLSDKSGYIRYEWPIQGELGNNAFLQKNGKLLINLKAKDPHINFGGYGGKLQLMDKDQVVWEYLYSSENYISHHDAKMLPNGNILFIAWIKKTPEESNEVGYLRNISLYPESVIEVSPISNQIIWRWNSWDHLIQDRDSTKLNYGDISKNPRRIDINYVRRDNGDIMHANGIDYDEENDLIFLSVNFYNEIWVIDHSTNTEEASTSSGGNYNHGGDLVYRFGNPETYGSSGPQIFYNNHHPHLLKGDKKGNILVYSNGKEQGHSTVIELAFPKSFYQSMDQNEEPIITWSYTNSQLFSPIVSGAVELPNGNRLITEGDFGLWEVTEEGELVWQYSYPGFFWRSYHYSKDAPEIKYLGL